MPAESQLVRLNKYIAQTGLCSRREADALISAGHVRVDGEVATLGSKIDLSADVLPDVLVRGQSLASQPTNFTYIMMNKPKGYTVTKAHFKNERGIMELLPDNLRHVNPVGRLDKNSQGLLILTDDGELIQQLTHPSFEKEKEYEVRAREPLTDEMLLQLQNGVRLEEGNTGHNYVRQLDDNSFSIVLHQGWKRQIRRMLEAVGNRVDELTRVRVGRLDLGKIPVGKWMVIQKEDIVGDEHNGAHQNGDENDELVSEENDDALTHNTYD